LLTYKQEHASETFHFIAVKSEFQEEVYDITTVNEKLKEEITVGGSEIS
jgi:hypothetical protein